MPQRPHQVGDLAGQDPDGAVAADGRQHRADDRRRLVDEAPIGLGLRRRLLCDGVDGLFHRAEEPHPSPVSMHGDRERVHFLVVEAGSGQVEVLRDVGHVDDVVGR